MDDSHALRIAPSVLPCEESLQSPVHLRSCLLAAAILHLPYAPESLSPSARPKSISRKLHPVIRIELLLIIEGMTPV